MTDDLRQVLADLIDDEPCRHDHHGHCQEHDWLPDGRCRTVVARDVLALLGQADEACGDDCPRLVGERPVACTLPKGHAVHRAAKNGMAWERLCDEVVQRTDRAEAAIARVRADCEQQTSKTVADDLARGIWAQARRTLNTLDAIEKELK